MISGAFGSLKGDLVLVFVMVGEGVALCGGGCGGASVSSGVSGSVR